MSGEESKTPSSPARPPPLLRRASSARLSSLPTFSGAGSDAGAEARVSEHLLRQMKIVLVLVGLPARGKSYITHKLTRYVNWMGFKVRVLHRSPALPCYLCYKGRRRVAFLLVGELIRRFGFLAVIPMLCYDVVCERMCHLLLCRRACLTRATQGGSCWALARTTNSSTRAIQTAQRNVMTWLCSH